MRPCPQADNSCSCRRTPPRTPGEVVPAIEVAAARLRACEFGRAVLQGAPTGYSAVIRPDGKVVAQSELGSAAVLRATVPLRTGLTPYARTGDLPALALAAGSLLLATLLGRRRSGPTRGRRTDLDPRCLSTPMGREAGRTETPLTAPGRTAPSTRHRSLRPPDLT